MDIESPIIMVAFVCQKDVCAVCMHPFCRNLACKFHETQPDQAFLDT